MIAISYREDLVAMTDIEPGSQSDQPFAIRPRVVGTASVLMIVFGAIAIVLTLVLIAAVNNDASQTGTSVDAGVYFLFIVQIVLSASQILSGVYIRPGRSWAWIVGITVCGLNLLFGLLSLAQATGAAGVVGLVLPAVLLAMLLRRDVRDWCRN